MPTEPHDNHPDSFLDPWTIDNILHNPVGEPSPEGLRDYNIMDNLPALVENDMYDPPAGNPLVSAEMATAKSGVYGTLKLDQGQMVFIPDDETKFHETFSNVVQVDPTELIWLVTFIQHSRPRTDDIGSPLFWEERGRKYAYEILAKLLPEPKCPVEEIVKGWVENEPK